MSVKITIDSCTKELTAKERVKMKDSGNAIAMDTLLDDGPVVIAPDYFAVLTFVNDNPREGDSPEYKKLILVDKSGTKYSTGSKPFIDTLQGIHDELAGEDYEIEVYRRESKNYKGKYFLNCSVV